MALAWFHGIDSQRTARSIALGVAIATIGATALVVLPVTAAGASETYTLYVNTSADNSNAQTLSTCSHLTNTTCTLRAALTLSNDGSAGESYLIDVGSRAKSLTITVNPNLGDYDSASDAKVTIEGSSPSATKLNGADQVRVLYDDDVNLVIENLTIENGLTDGPGAGLDNYGVATLDNVNFTNNVQDGSTTGGGAIYSDYKLTMNGGTVEDNTSNDCAGALDNEATATVSHLSFLDNSSDCGGAINNDEDATLAVSDSTFVGNSVRDYDDGGAISNNGMAVITNSTITRNVSDEDGGGIVTEEDGSTSINFDTIVNNYALQGGGGVSDETGASLEVEGSILEGNTEGFGGVGQGVTSQCIAYGNFTSGGDNAVGPATDRGCAFSAAGDLTNTPVALGPLAHNGGGPETMALSDAAPFAVLGSPSICPRTDERGQVRGGDCAVGAYQPLPTKTATTCTTLSGSTSGSFTLSHCTSTAPHSTSVTGSGALFSGSRTKLTWHSSGAKTTVTVTITEILPNRCGGGDETIGVAGVVTVSATAAAPYFNHVSLTACSAPGTGVLHLFKKTVATL
jgi:hypothetical protein